MAGVTVLYSDNVTGMGRARNQTSDKWAWWMMCYGRSVVSEHDGVVDSVIYHVMFTLLCWQSTQFPTVRPS